jgi:hypothetical protein
MNKEFIVVCVENNQEEIVFNCNSEEEARKEIVALINKKNLSRKNLIDWQYNTHFVKINPNFKQQISYDNTIESYE